MLVEYESNQNLKRIAAILEQMYELQKKEFEIKYGKDEEEEDKLSEVAKDFGVTAERFEEILRSVFKEARL